MYKRALHSFFLKVHPDFFALHKEAQTANEKSIAQLNELLGWAKDFKAGAVRSPPAMSITLTFYSQNDDTTTAAAKSVGGSEKEALTPIVSKFELPPTFTATDANRGVAERSVNKFLRDLLRRANCMDTASEAQSVAEDAESERMEVKPLRRRVNDAQRAKMNSKKTKTLLDEATESLAERWTITESPTAEELMAADQILFSRNLSPLQSAAALQSLQAFLPDMQYHRWAAMPLIISDQYAIGEITGAISVSWDFTLESFLAFLDKNSKQIAECEQSALHFAQTIESLITQVCKELDLDDILVSCSHRDALPALQVLKAQAPLLRAANVSSITLEIANKFGYRDNGVVIIDKMVTPLTLRDALAKLKPRMGMQQQLYKASKMMLESTEWHLSQFKENAKPRAVDLYNNNYTYAERLQFVKELYTIGPTLAQWDWSEFVFTLGDLDIDWNRQTVVLPPNFDGQSFVRYVEEVHKAAKDMKMEQLTENVLMDAKVEAATKKFNYAGDAAGDDPEVAEAQREMLRKQQEESRCKASYGPVKSSVTEGSPEDSQIDRDVLAAHQQQAATMNATEAQRAYDLMQTHRAWLKKNNPHLEEYLASSPDGNDQLSVERPLHHDLNFDADEHSGEVAADNMRWEGFYDDPYVQTVPARDLDDVAHAYLCTDRKHREEAVKKLVKEVQERMGSGKRMRDAQYKMGDIMGLNNPNAKPSGFPTLAKGTFTGERASIRPF